MPETDKRSVVIPANSADKIVENVWAAQETGEVHRYNMTDKMLYVNPTKDTPQPIGFKTNGEGLADGETTHGFFPRGSQNYLLFTPSGTIQGALGDPRQGYVWKKTKSHQNVYQLFWDQEQYDALLKGQEVDGHAAFGPALADTNPSFTPFA